MNTGPYLNWIGGEWLAGNTTTTNINPSDLSDTIGEYALADAGQVESAVEAARSAQRSWAETGLEKRYQVLHAIGDELMARSAELGRELSREEGKPLAEGKGEVYRSGQFFTYYAAEVLRQMGETADSVRPGIEIDIRREPVGVVGVISPWNFPMATAVWKIAPALAFGNAVVWKPAELVPHSAWALAEIISRQADLPAGTFNLIIGKGSMVGQALIESKRIHAVSFTGSLAVGQKVLLATAKNMVRCQLELGSKNALVVMDDANLDTAVQAAVAGGYSGSGQKCTASSRLIVHEAIHDRFVEALADKLRAMTVGPGLDEATQVGPVVSAQALAGIEAHIQAAEKAGAKRLCGGERVNAATDGHFLSPALLVDTDNTMTINREEVFGPVACVIKARDFEHALALTNDTEYGLTAGIITESLSHAYRFKREAQAGCVMVNLATAGTDYHVPFGGTKASSFGTREQGQYAREFYTEVKTTYIKAG
ncbi:MAG: aldehyde dehydrogenase family protein [Salinisphaera sp.]|jgi:acyl-CoA reductase-like NAD-dependent aldehyde dehydrogenase|nr:aldehyde dehydrogenase family protein [Salinisphaera sp.]